MTYGIHLLPDFNLLYETCFFTKSYLEFTKILVKITLKCTKNFIIFICYNFFPLFSRYSNFECGKHQKRLLFGREQN